jgi:acetyltransferase-like isoleucine patch superfamily enzyme
MLNQTIAADKLYALEEGTIEVGFWGGDRYFDFSKIDKNTTAFSSGVLYFCNSPEMKSLFTLIRTHVHDDIYVKKNKIDACFDQPLIVFNAINENKYNNQFLKPYVELLANVCVARALFGGETTLGEETVADNLVYIAHDVQIGRRVQICALVNILGRVEIGDEAYIGPSSVIINGARIGEKAKVSIGAVVTRDVPAGTTVSGNFAIPHDRFLTHLRSVR